MDPISSFGAATTEPTRAARDGFSTLGSEEFVKLILTELGKQDPLQPNDTGALLDQLSTVRSIQSDMDLTKRLEEISGNSEFASAAGLIGKEVSGLAEGLGRVSGRVQAVGRTEAGALLVLEHGELIQMSKLERILSAA